MRGCERDWPVAGVLVADATSGAGALAASPGRFFGVAHDRRLRQRAPMHAWMIIGAMLLATLGLSLGFWLWLMPRLGAENTSRRARVSVVFGFAVVLLALPVVALLLIEDKTVVIVCALIVGWAMAVRATAWFAARLCLVPRLRAMREAAARESGPSASPNEQPSGPGNGCPSD